MSLPFERESKASSGEWTSPLPQFKGISVNSIVHNLNEVLLPIFTLRASLQDGVRRLQVC